MTNLAYQPQKYTHEIVLVFPILLGKAEAWRRFIQKIESTYLAEYETSRQRMCINSERAWLHVTAQGEQVIIIIDVDCPELALSELMLSEAPFDIWFREQIRDLSGLDLRQAWPRAVSDCLLAWSTSKPKGGIYR